MSMGTMAGAGKKRRRPMSEINMTPLVDVMLVLLVIFMITAPHLDKDSVDIDLPQTKGNPGAGKVGVPWTVSIDASNNVYVAGQKIQPSDISTELPKLLKGHEKEAVTLKAARSLNWESVVKVISVIRSNGITAINIVVEGAK